MRRDPSLQTAHIVPASTAGCFQLARTGRAHTRRDANFSTARWSNSPPGTAPRSDNQTNLHLAKPYSSCTNKGLPVKASFISTLSGVRGHSDKHATGHIPEAQCAFKVLMIHEVLQFALRIAFRCVLHRCGSLDIRC